jgi:hypothetical protein
MARACGSGSALRQGQGGPIGGSMLTRGDFDPMIGRSAACTVVRRTGYRTPAWPPSPLQDLVPDLGLCTSYCICLFHE